MRTILEISLFDDATPELLFVLAVSVLSFVAVDNDIDVGQVFVGFVVVVVVFDPKTDMIHYERCFLSIYL